MQADPNNIYNKQKIIEELKKHDITHVAYNDNYLRKRLKDTIIESNRLNQIYQDNYMTVSEILY